jgi:vitamin B12 transporter
MTATLLFFLLAVVRGVVSDPSGRTVPGAQVACGREIRTTTETGAFELPAACQATITKPGFAPARVALTEAGANQSGVNQITLALAPASDRVLVTATGAPVAIEEAGVAATVFTARDFQAPHAPFVQDLLREVPGLDMVQSGQNGGITSLFARGGDSSSALVLLDGVPITEPGGGIDFVHLTSAGLDRMEVIRGPESALFGAEASSVVIQLFTQRGDPEATVPHGSLVYDRGSFSTDHWAGTLDGGLADRLDYAFTADQFRSTGEFPNDAYRITTGTANLGYRFSAATQLRAVYREFDSYTGDPGLTADQSFDLLSRNEDRDSALSVRLDDARGAQYVQQVTFGYHRYRDRYNDGFDPTSLTVTDRDVAGYQGTLTHLGGALVFGYEFQRQAGIVSGTGVARYDNGFYANEQYAIAPRIFMTAGARLEHSNIFGTRFAPRGAVTFRLPREVYFRLSASRGIQEPSLVENFARELYYVGNPALKPETTDSFEAGLSREWFSRRLRTEASFFRNSFDSLILFDFSVDPGTWRNVEQSWARGFELSGTLRLTRVASLRGAYTRLYTRITQSNDPTQIGMPLLRRPLNAGSVSLELAPRRWTFAAGARLVGERPDSDFLNPGVLTAPAYQYVFLSGSWQATQHLEPFLRIGNALDERYQEVLGYLALARTVTGGMRVSW